MNIELLIALVKERSVLYDIRNPLHKDKREKERKWREICTATDVTIEVAKTRWRSLKDCYTKHLKCRRGNAGQASSKYAHWQWAKHMEFMKSHLNSTSTMTYLKQENQETDDMSTQSNSYAQGTQSSSDEQVTQSSPNLPTTHVRSHADVQRRRRRTILASSDATTSLNTDRIIKYFDNKEKSSYDATELIFLGYAKSIKPFSIRRQARIKMNIAKMIMEEEIAHFEET